MTDPRDDGHYEAPIERLSGFGTNVRRARIVAIAVTLIVGSAIGLAVLPGTSPAPSPPTAPIRAGVPSPTTAATSHRVETLVAAPDAAIPGAPRPILIERRGDDALIVRWTPGQGLAAVGTIPGAFVGLDSASIYPILAPTSDRLLVLSTGDPATGGDRGRLVDASGTILWEGDGLTALSGAVWSPDGQTVVAAASGRQWRIVRIDGATAVARTVVVTGDVIPGSSPSAPAIPPGPVSRTVPLGFSTDGQWIYGAVISPQLAMISSEFRVSVARNRAQPVTSFGVGRPDGLAQGPGTLGDRIVDPTSGRTADWRTNSDFTGGPPTIEVRNADGTFAFVLDEGTPLGSAWNIDGGLYVLLADNLAFPDAISLVRVDQAGAVGSPIFETGPVGGAALIGVWNGFAALGLTVARPSSAAQLVLVDLAVPGRTAAIQLPRQDSGSFIAATLWP